MYENASGVVVDALLPSCHLRTNRRVFGEELGAYYNCSYVGFQDPKIFKNDTWREDGCSCKCSHVQQLQQRKSILPSEIIEATEDGGMCRLLALLAADHPALPTLLQVGSNFWTWVILQERLPRLLQLLHLPPVFQDGARDPIWEECPLFSHWHFVMRLIELFITLVSKSQEGRQFVFFTLGKLNISGLTLLHSYSQYSTCKNSMSALFTRDMSILESFSSSVYMSNLLDLFSHFWFTEIFLLRILKSKSAYGGKRWHMFWHAG